MEKSRAESGQFSRHAAGSITLLLYRNPLTRVSVLAPRRPLSVGLVKSVGGLREGGGPHQCGWRGDERGTQPCGRRVFQLRLAGSDDLFIESNILLAHYSG